VSEHEALAAAALEEWGNAEIRRVETEVKRQALTEKCDNCRGTGEDDPPVDPVGNHIPCPSCHGRGTVYPPALVERIARIINELAGAVSEEEVAVAALDAINDWKPE